MGEQIATLLASGIGFLLIGSLKKYKPIPATAVAYAMYQVANKEMVGNHIYESDRLVALNDL